jgi:hypothetical protein
MKTITIGQTYNKLTALKPEGKNNHGKIMWLFQCECGQRTKAIGSCVKNGRTKSCGCLRTFAMKRVNVNRRLYPIVGKVYGQLIAIEDSGEKTKDFRSLWWFDCSCGNRCKASASTVIYGNQKSCGCRAISLHMRKGQALYPSNVPLETRAAKQAWHKTYSDGLDFEDFLRLSQEPCHYCGDRLSNTYTRKYSDGLATFRYNGLDRRDSARDHSLDNVIPCCCPCNLAKGARTYEEFMAWNARVYFHMLASAKDRSVIMTRDTESQFRSSL